jgi:hypothetical protein
MNSNKFKCSAAAIIFSALLALAGNAILYTSICSSAAAQQKTPQAVPLNAGPSAYQAARETIISGKVLQYSATSTNAPMGAHITLQTSSGTVDVHAGNAQLINASHIALQSGDTISITGENVSFDNKTVFVARVIQKGTQSLVVRSQNGLPLLPTARSADGKIVDPGGAR